MEATRAGENPNRAEIPRIESRSKATVHVIDPPHAPGYGAAGQTFSFRSQRERSARRINGMQDRRGGGAIVCGSAG